MNAPKLSVIIITKNEEDNILDCLYSVKWADEIIVIDSGSTDSTIEICLSQGVRVEKTIDWQGFGIQKNRALALAKCDWVLSIDADERVSVNLQTEIKNLLQNAPQNTAFKIPRYSSFCGQFIRHSGWYPDYVIRLFRRGEAHFSNDIVHEKLITNCNINTLISPLIHFSYSNFEDVLSKLNRYSSDGAMMLSAKNKKATFLGAIFRGFWAFFRTYFIKLGFLDGQMGLVLAIYNAEVTYYKYLKLIYLQSKKEK